MVALPAAGGRSSVALRAGSGEMLSGEAGQADWTNQHPKQEAEKLEGMQ